MTRVRSGTGGAGKNAADRGGLSGVASALTYIVVPVFRRAPAYVRDANF
jgi:hypothetical protein